MGESRSGEGGVVRGETGALSDGTVRGEAGSDRPRTRSGAVIYGAEDDRVMVRLSAELGAGLRGVAERRGVTVSELLRGAAARVVREARRPR
jgi:hypothetical protein